MLKWTEIYGIHTASLKGMLQLQVMWDSNGYTVSVTGMKRHTLPQPITDLEDAKRAAIEYAWAWLNDMLHVINAELEPAQKGNHDDER